jgi:hypothetical protein
VLPEEPGPKNLLHIDARNHSSSAALDRVYDEMTIQKEQLGSHDDEDQDLLDLLDSAL